jgi:hypothetical protein
MIQKTLATIAALLFVASARPSSAQTHTPLTFDGDVALWTVAVKPDKTADFETVITKLRDGLLKSSKPERQQQAAGWRVVKLAQPLPDGNVGYVHIVRPVVKGADYTVMQVLYDEFPEERQALYELYRGAFAKNLSLAIGSVVADMAIAAPAPSGTSESAR